MEMEDSEEESFIVLGMDSDSGEITDDDIVILYEPEVPSDSDTEGLGNQCMHFYLSLTHPPLCEYTIPIASMSF